MRRETVSRRCDFRKQSCSFGTGSMFRIFIAATIATLTANHQPDVPLLVGHLDHHAANTARSVQRYAESVIVVRKRLQLSLPKHISQGHRIGSGRHRLRITQRGSQVMSRAKTLCIHKVAIRMFYSQRSGRSRTETCLREPIRGWFQKFTKLCLQVWILRQTGRSRAEFPRRRQRRNKCP